jgi:hypothetical protein
LLIRCSHDRRTHTDASRHPSPGRRADAGGDACPGRTDRAARISADVVAMTAAIAKEPFDGYDKLKGKEVAASLSSHSQTELAEIERYEVSHENRPEVIDKLRWMRQDEPVPGYDAMSVDEIAAALDKADLSTLKRVRGYERKFGDRRGVLDEVARLHQERRVPLVSRDSAR